MNPNIVYADKQHHNYLRAFILIKPSKPFYEEGQDYQIRQPFTEEVLSNARLVWKRTFELHKIPEIYAYLCMDLNLQTLTGVLSNQSTEREWDVLLFSGNSYYGDFYRDKKVESKKLRKKQAEQLEIPCENV
ncbi:hypothetical protein [Flagellimonas onchidii]|uniref:hypothetical protein n=1 Tax=Flagellimonas onchidii TaxID=2562684 RepID=UPI0010A5E4FA|nr:hypothetical protein [Allomuricauda onchidii]